MGLRQITTVLLLRDIHFYTFYHSITFLSQNRTPPPSVSIFLFVIPCFKTHISGGLAWRNNEIRGISFITILAILIQSAHFAQRSQGPEIQADQAPYHTAPPPPLLLSLYLLSFSQDLPPILSSFSSSHLLSLSSVVAPLIVPHLRGLTFPHSSLLIKDK